MSFKILNGNRKTFYANYLRVLTVIGLFLQMSVTNLTSLARMEASSVVLLSRFTPLCALSDTKMLQSYPEYNLHSHKLLALLLCLSAQSCSEGGIMFLVFFLFLNTLTSLTTARSFEGSCR